VSDVNEHHFAPCAHEEFAASAATVTVALESSSSLFPFCIPCICIYPALHETVTFPFSGLSCIASEVSQDGNPSARRRGFYFFTLYTSLYSL